MNKKEVLDYYGIKPDAISKKGLASIITAGDKKYVIKKINRKVDPFSYLITRHFNNFPKVYSSMNDEIELTDYIEEKNTPLEQKLEDLVYLVSILHIKTTFYKDVDEDYLKNIYESIINKQEKMINYYNELQNMIELEVYMSPANYLLVRNVSILYLAINKSREYIEKWYDVIKEVKKIRLAYIHGNLDYDHLIEGDDLYLISWDKSRVDLPIYDLETLYRNNYFHVNLESILEIYESKYPLKKEEYYLLMSILLIPDKIDLSSNEYAKTKQVSNLIFYMNKILTYLKNNSNKANNN